MDKDVHLSSSSFISLNTILQLSEYEFYASLNVFLSILFILVLLKMELFS
jgi:hypothetical protein